MLVATLSLCLLALLLQVAVLRDTTIIEVAVAAGLRKLTIVAHATAAGTLVYALWESYEIRLPLILTILIVALRDCYSAGYRLWPEAFANGDDQDHDRDHHHEGRPARR